MQSNSIQNMDAVSVRGFAQARQFFRKKLFFLMEDLHRWQQDGESSVGKQVVTV